MDDPRCCGTGTCLINAEGRCWCGQQWNGDRMCFPEPSPAGGDTASSPDTLDTSEGGDSGGD